VAGFLIAAGEASGDYYAAQVAGKLIEEDKNLYLWGLGGEKMRDAGVEIFYNPLDRGTFGVAGALRNLKFLLKLARETAQKAQEKNLEKALLVDFSGFNMYLGSLLRKRGLEVIHFIPPGVWFWGRWRAKFLARRGIKAACIFPQEAEIYRKSGAETYFVGHPLARELQEPDRKEKGLIVLLPGSREQEIKDHLEILIKAALKMQSENRDLKFVVGQALGLSDYLFSPAEDAGIEVRKGETRSLLGKAELALTASGTATLEGALLGTPSIIIYRTDDLTYFLGRKLARVSAVGLPNLLLGEKFLPELLQNDFTAENVAREAGELMQPENYLRAREKLARIKDILGEEDAAGRVARLLLKTGG